MFASAERMAGSTCALIHLPSSPPYGPGRPSLLSFSSKQGYRRTQIVVSITMLTIFTGAVRSPLNLQVWH